MKIGRYLADDGSERLGVVLEEASALSVLDLGAAARARSVGESFPASMDKLIRSGERGLAQANSVIEWAVKAGERQWFKAERDVTWIIPVQVRNCLAAGANFAKHRAEVAHRWPEGFHDVAPMGFAKLASIMVPTRSTVTRPPDVLQFDYEVEVAAVIGQRAERVSEANALKQVFGYTILNDLSAREWQRKEMENRAILLGKNFPGFGPLGPWIVTADELPDPAVMEVKLSVNGEARQLASCRDMIFSFAMLIAHWSKIGLDVGDLVTSGTPEGVAVGMKPDPTSYFLKPGDRIEASVTPIGVLETWIE